jgi:hypothetical protein
MADDISAPERDDLLSRAHAVLRAHLAHDEPAIVALVGDDSGTLMPVLVGLLVGLLVQGVPTSWTPT